MIEIKTWMDKFLKVLNDTFGDRVWFVGLQGSYGRGETTEKSDIDIVVILDDTAVTRAIKIGECNIYHGCVHNMLYEKSEHILRGLYKSASFVVQAIAFKQTGKYITHQKDLLEIISVDERVIVETFLKLKNGEKIDFDAMSETLFKWAKKWIEKTK